jgi:Na+-driven multidrug efflux pump
MLQDSLAVSVQTLLARSAAAARTSHCRAIVRAGVVLSAVLGALLTGCLAAGSYGLPMLFTQDVQVRKW